MTTVTGGLASLTVITGVAERLAWPSLTPVMVMAGGVRSMGKRIVNELRLLNMSTAATERTCEPGALTVVPLTNGASSRRSVELNALWSVMVMVGVTG